ncbi:response regulator transcription factor [Ramlibacter rhizophilus]|uniref:LuxR family transcriptional regulator n=1 Tax=Ramlibacter rhizophilus TaxID=1781167 RepID=A0A4Z0BI88_9BURK|nr:LuxR family transcriptional regulator [Ramlibacter rhizophilus]
MTPAETEVLGLLAEGMVVKAIAQQRSCSPYTVRAQLASLLQKTGCHSQREVLTKLGKHLTSLISMEPSRERRVLFQSASARR